MSRYEDKIADILANAVSYHSSFYAANTFSGPSLYFHIRSIDTRTSADLTTHLEYIYATLAAWAMHRPGRGGSKMKPFEVFEKSMEPLQNKIRLAQQIKPTGIIESDWDLLKDIFFGIQIMASGTSIVGNSKVMAHMMPNIVPPIDREYTLKYLSGSTMIKNDLEQEWALMKGIVSGFFIPIAEDPKFAAQAQIWIGNQEIYPWDTSIFKVIDNLVIGSRK